jgi:hypothetical protein
VRLSIGALNGRWWSRARGGFHQLNPIAEWIVDIAAVVAVEGLLLDYVIAVVGQAFDEGGRSETIKAGCAFLAGLKSWSTPRWIFTESVSNQQPPRFARCGGFWTSGIPSVRA